MASPRGIRAGKAFVELSADNSKLIRGLKRANARIKAFGANVRKVGASLVKVGAMMGGGLLAATKVFADFERQMANVSTMLEQPERHMARLTKGIREMSVKFGESTETLAAGLYDILSASIPAEKALDVLAVSARAAKAGLTDTGVAADAITTILNSYGMSADKAGEVSDLLFTVVKRGKTTFGELAPQIGMVASTAASAGVGLDELGASLAVLTRNGVKTENAVTAVNQIILSFLKPSAEASKYARELGFEMSSATLKAEGLQGVFERIKDLPPDAITKLFPNARALRGVIPALKNMKGFVADVEAMRAKAGATEAAYAKMTGTLGHAFGQLKQSVVGVLSVIGEALAPTFKRLAGDIRANVGQIIGWVRANKDAIIQTLKVTAAIAGIGVALVSLGAVVSALGTVIGGLIAVVKTAILVVRGLGTAMTFLARNPAALLAVVLGALVASTIDWSAALKRLTGAIKGLLPQFKAFNAMTHTSAEQIRAEHEQMKLKANRLAELRAKQHLTNEEMVEARTLSHDLLEAYPKMGKAIESLGRSAGSAAKLLERMNQAFAENTRAFYAAQLRATENRIKALKRQQQQAREARARVTELTGERGSIPVYGDPVTSTVNNLAWLFGSDFRMGREGRIQKLDRQIKEAKALAGSFEDVGKEIATAEGNAARLRKTLKEMAAVVKKGPKAPEAAPAAPAGPNIFQRLVGSVPDLLRRARQLPGQVWDAVQQGMAAYKSRNAELFHDLKVLDAQRIRDDIQRELAMTRLAYEQKIRMARQAGQDISLIEKAREKELAQIKTRHAEDAARTRREREKALDLEMERFAVEQAKQGTEQRIALLRIEERERIAAAKAAGLGDAYIRKLRTFYAAQRKVLGLAKDEKAAGVKDAVDRVVGVRGTFNAMQARGLAAGGATDRIVTAVEKTEKHTKKVANAAQRGGLAFV